MLHFQLITEKCSATSAPVLDDFNTPLLPIYGSPPDNCPSVALACFVKSGEMVNAEWGYPLASGFAVLSPHLTSHVSDIHEEATLLKSKPDISFPNGLSHSNT